MRLGRLYALQITKTLAYIRGYRQIKSGRNDDEQDRFGGRGGRSILFVVLGIMAFRAIGAHAVAEIGFGHQSETQRRRGDDQLVQSAVSQFAAFSDRPFRTEIVMFAQSLTVLFT